MRRATRGVHDAARTTQAGTMLVLLGALSGCGGRIEPANTEAPLVSASAFQSTNESVAPPGTSSRRTALTVAAPPAIATPPRGVLLTGLPGANACSALRVYVIDAADAQTSASRRTPLTAFIDPTATVGQVNAALNAVGARIVAMQPGRNAVAIELEDEGGTKSPRDTVARLMASRAFQWVQGPGLPTAPVALAVDPAASEPIDDHAPPP